MQLADPIFFHLDFQQQKYRLKEAGLIQGESHYRSCSQTDYVTDEVAVEIQFER